VVKVGGVVAGGETTSARIRLQGVSGHGAGRAFDLTQERVNIGRDGSNLICLDDETVSSHHALLIRAGDHFKLRDLISTNGTYLNGERTMDAVLRHGDLLRFGEVEMRYEEIETTPTSRTEPPRTVLPLGQTRPIPPAPAGERQPGMIGADRRAFGPVDASTMSAPQAIPAGKSLGAPPKGKPRAVYVVACATLVIVVGGTVAAWWYDQWPFSLRGPLKHYAHGAEGFIYSDPNFVAAESEEDTRDFARLLKDARQLVANYPENSLAHYILGVAYGKLNFFADAAASFQQAIKLKPDYIDAWNNLGWAYSKLGKFADAAPVFEQLVKFTPKDARAWSNLGAARAGQGRKADAIAAYQMAIRLKTDDPDAHFNLGVAYASQGNFEEAVTSFRQALKYQADFPEAWFNLGVVCSRQDSNDEAAVYFQQAVKSRPDYADAWVGLVKTYLAMHETEHAGEAARELKRIDPAKADQLADELSREEPKPVAETAQSEVQPAAPPQSAAEQFTPTDNPPPKPE
jgi:tetratricopeptide (TPR) repeat protein